LYDHDRRLQCDAGPPGHRLEENLAADVTLTPAELAHLNHLSSRIEIHGGRYPDSLEAQTNL